MRIFRTQNGFTLTELLVVIFIIGVLAALVLPRTLGAKLRVQQAQSRANLNVIQAALETFQMENNGNYPGAALYEAVSVDDHSWIMRGVIGGALIQDDASGENVYGPFYFDPLEDPEANPLRRPDRLFDSGSIDAYPYNPFQKYVASGHAAEGQNRPMVNIFGIENDKNNLGQDRYANWGELINFSWALENNIVPSVDMFTVNDGEGNPGYGFEYIDAGFGNWWGNAEDTSNPQDWAYTGVLDEDLFTAVPLAGNFSYIPLHPLQKEYTSPDFMKFVEGYWLILYGHPKDSSRNRYGNVVPHFKDKGDGQGDGDDTTATIFEQRVEEATLGAHYITGTMYKPLIDKQ